MPLRPLVLGLVAAALLAVPALSGAATKPGENGRIVFVSGRDVGNTVLADSKAQIYLLPVPSSTGGGTLSGPITSDFTVQHRHPTWSPDRTKIAYSRGTPPNDLDIYVQDLTSPGSTPVDITNSAGVPDDRPAWSPDGSKIAYQSGVAAGSNQTDILIKNADGSGTATNFTNTPNVNGAQFEGRPAWSPNGDTLYYEKGINPNSNADGVDIVKKAVAGGSETLAVADSTHNEFQPAISPDGTKICYVKSVQGFNGTADVLVAPLTNPPSAGTVVSQDSSAGDYNCTWSPDGTEIAYVNGIFGTGQLVMVNADGSSLFPVTLAQDPNGNRFDGNPDWAPDARPVCDDTTATTKEDTPVEINADCNDTGPQYEQTTVRDFIKTQPSHGKAEQEFAGDPITYTPNAGFSGTDSFTVSSFDELGFGSDTGKVTVKVTPKLRCGHKKVTIFGTPAGETLNGTKGPDVFAAFGGADKIRGKGGRDIVCGGGGKDSIDAGSGNDLVFGQGGNDSIKGGSGRDTLNGGSGKDRIRGEGGRDKLNGNSGRDSLDGGKSRDRCNGGSGRDRGKRCEIRTSIP